MSDIIKTQQGLARKAETDRTHHFEDLYHILCKREWIEEALQHVLDNDGSQTAGVDGVSWKTFNDVDKKDFENEKFKQQFIDTLQAELKNRTFKPMPVRRVEIPKPGTNKKRPLGIPTVKDRCVQTLLKMLMSQYGKQTSSTSQMDFGQGDVRWIVCNPCTHFAIPQPDTDG